VKVIGSLRGSAALTIMTLGIPAAPLADPAQPTL
jgi:hypothetical protein